jgi:hypothetical protein
MPFNVTEEEFNLKVFGVYFWQGNILTRETIHHFLIDYFLLKMLAGKLSP